MKSYFFKLVTLRHVLTGFFLSLHDILDEKNLDNWLVSLIAQDLNLQKRDLRRFLRHLCNRRLQSLLQLR
jgi:hypothetical protein